MNSILFLLKMLIFRGQTHFVLDFPTLHKASITIQMITFGKKKTSLKFFDLNRIIHVEQHEFYAICQHKSNHCQCPIATNCIQNTSMLNCTKTLIHIEFILRLMRTHDLIQKLTENCIVSKCVWNRKIFWGFGKNDRNTWNT